MKYTQNDKILQITDKTLIVGVDIAKEVHYARAFDYRGIELGKIFRFGNLQLEFDGFRAWVHQVFLEYGKDGVIVGMEPTGHYWYNLAHYIVEHDMRITLVNPYHVKRAKELDDNSPTKNDQKDSKTIAMLVKDGRYSVPYIPQGIC